MMLRRLFLTLFLLAGALAARGQTSCVDADGVRWTVTEAGEILRSPDDESWTAFDFNAQYAGFYPQMHWRAVAAGGGSVMVAGLDAEGHLGVYASSRGTVWSPRSLEYKENGEPRVLDVVPSTLSYDPIRDSFFLCGSQGTLFEMPGCSHCNRLTRYPCDTLYSREQSGFDALLRGSWGFEQLVKP